MFDYLIAGGGLAGATLALRLKDAGCRVMLLDDPAANHSSLIAAGIVNPLTGKKMVKTWMADLLFPELHRFYTQAEQRFGECFFYDLPVFRIFEDQYSQNEILERIANGSAGPFAQPQVEHLDDDRVSQPFGALKVLQSGRLDIPLYLGSVRKYLQKQEAYLSTSFNEKEFSINKDRIKFRDLEAKHLILCEGYTATRTVWFSHLPWNTVHGEILELEMDGMYTDRILIKGVFMLPVGMKRYLAGATYNWNLKEPVTTENGPAELERKLRAAFKLPFRIIGQRAGIRPSTRDRRPFLGRHPENPNVMIFNGFGSKGVSLIPWLSLIFTEYLLKGAGIPTETDICRFHLK